MNPSPVSKAGKAYEQGIKAAMSGGSEKDNPYLLARVIHLKNWWMKGFNENKQI